MNRRKWIAVIISAVFISVSVGAIAMEYHNEANVYPFHLNTTYFNPKVNATYFLEQGTHNFTSFYTPVVKSLEVNYSEKTVNFSFGEYTLLMTPNLLPIPTVPINLFNFSSLNLSSTSKPISFLEPVFGIAMVNVTSGNPRSLGFLPVQAKVIAPNGSAYVFNLKGQNNAVLVETIYGEPINIGSYYYVSTGIHNPTNYTMPLVQGQYMLQSTISLYHLQTIGYSYLGSLTLTVPFFDFVEK